MGRYRKFVTALGGAVVAWGLFFGVNLEAPVVATVTAVLVWLMPNEH